MVSFIDAHRDAHGVEPICRVLPIAPSTYHDRLAKRVDPARLIGAGLVGLFSAGAAFGVLAGLFETIRSPVIRLIVALIFAAPAAVAGYALVHGITKEAVPSDFWRQIFCIAGGGFVGFFALSRLVNSVGHPAK